MHFPNGTVFVPLGPKLVEQVDPSEGTDGHLLFSINSPLGFEMLSGLMLDQFYWENGPGTWNFAPKVREYLKLVNLDYKSRAGVSVKLVFQLNTERANAVTLDGKKEEDPLRVVRVKHDKKEQIPITYKNFMDKLGDHFMARPKQ